MIRLNDITIQSGQTKERGQQVAKDAKGKDCKTHSHSAASGQCGCEGIARCVSGRQPLRRRSGSTARRGYGILANIGLMVGCGLVTTLILIVILSLTAARKRIVALIWR